MSDVIEKQTHHVQARSVLLAQENTTRQIVDAQNIQEAKII